MHGFPGPSGSAAAKTALDRLTAPPTNAPIELTPDVPDGDTECDTKVAHPADGSSIAGDWPASVLWEIGFWRRLTNAYSTGLSTPYLPVGGACGLQHYAGRFVLAVLGVWVQTGRLLSMAHSDWRVRLNAEGHTIAVRPPVADVRSHAGVTDVAEAILLGHMRPIVDAVRQVTRITDRVAYGCIAASCAGAFGRLHRRATAEGRDGLVAVARRFHDLDVWPGGRPLLELSEIDVPAGTALVHQRRVCCLIRLGEGHGACETCPDIDPAERWTQITWRAASALHSHDLPTAVGDA